MELNENFDDSPRLKSENIPEYMCRICFESEEESKPLITPCKCSGSMKYIHEECLKIWLLSQDKDLGTSECDVCKSKFTMKIITATKCTCKNYWAECLGMFIFPVLLVLMASILTVIMLFLVQGIEQHKTSAGEETYLILLILACTVIIIIIFVIFVKSIKRGCFSTELVSWNIESQSHEEELDNTLEHHNPTLQQDEVNIMVVPKLSKLNGKNIVRPLIMTPRLLPIMRSGELVGYRPRALTNRSVNSSQVLNLSQSITPGHLSQITNWKVAPLP